MHDWSAQQLVIFTWFREGKGNLLVRARAGTGKTSTIVHGVKLAPDNSILVCAFSKIIEIELIKRIGKHPRIYVKTLHALGLSCVHKFREGIKVDFSSTRADYLTDTVCGVTVPDEIKKLITKLHTKGREIRPHARYAGDLLDVAIQFECEPPENWANSGFPLEKIEDYALKAMDLASQVGNNSVIDGSDMIFLPVRNKWLVPRFNLVVVDEAQDMTTAQLEIATGMLKPGGRMCIVGDDKQAIFAFRGADSDALDRLKIELRAQETGLTTTYRCGKTIVELVQHMVPDFHAGPDNPPGLIKTIHEDRLVEEAAPGDYVLSRVNAPLVHFALRMLKAGKRTRIAGNDIGAGLIKLTRKMRARTPEDFINKVTLWEAKELSRLQAIHDGLPEATRKRHTNALENKMAEVSDKAMMLMELAEEAETMQVIENRITALFQDDGLGNAGVITCSSVHRAKGLEARKVFILEWTLRDYNQEEKNIVYVAITRAKEELVWVEE